METAAEIYLKKARLAQLEGSIARLNEKCFALYQARHRAQMDLYALERQVMEDEEVEKEIREDAEAEEERAWQREIERP